MRHGVKLNLATPRRSSTARQIDSHRKQAERAAREVVEHNNAIAALQRQCIHTWKFSCQENNYDQELWNVMEKCSQCDSTRHRICEPVCEACDCTLVRAEANDKEAERERSMDCYEPSAFPPDNNPPIAFRCPQCSRIHILWLLGD